MLLVLVYALQKKFFSLIRLAIYSSVLLLYNNPNLRSGTYATATKFKFIVNRYKVPVSPSLPTEGGLPHLFIFLTF